MNNPATHAPLATIIQTTMLALLVTMLILPFAINQHLPPNPSFWNEALAVGIGLLACLGMLAGQYWRPFRFPVIAFLPLGMIVILVFQMRQGLMTLPSQHLTVILYFLWALLMMLLGIALRHSLGLPKMVTALAAALLAGGVLSAILQALQLGGLTLGGLIMPATKGYHGNLGQVNHLANYFGLSIASLAYLSATRRLRVSWVFAFSCLLLAALAITGARAGWLYLSLITALAWLAHRHFPCEPSARLWKFSRALIPGFVLVQLMLPWLPVDQLIMPGHALLEKAAGGSYRIELWREALTISQYNPWLGVGFGRFSWFQFQLAWPNTPEGYTRWAEHSHNIFLQLLAETGVAGVLIFSLFIGLWFWSGRKIPLNAERYWILALLGIISIHSLLEYPLWYAYFLGPMALLLGMGDEKSLAYRLPGVRWLLAPILTLGLLLLIATMQQNVTVEKWVVRGNAGQFRGEHARAFFEDMLKVARGSLITPSVFSMIDVAMEMDRTNLRQQLYVNSITMQHHANPEAAYRRATLLALDDQKEAALLQLRRALVAFPLNDKLRNRYVMSLTGLVNRGETAVEPLLEGMVSSTPDGQQVNEGGSD